MLSLKLYRVGVSLSTNVVMELSQKLLYIGRTEVRDTHFTILELFKET